MSQKVNVVNLAARMAKMIPTENWPETVNGYFEFENKFFTFLHSIDMEDRLELIFQIFYKNKIDPETIRKNVKGARVIVVVENQGTDGKEDCNICDASGDVSCDSCYGDGYRECDNCDGTGETECPECSGSGEDAEGEECSQCNGSGDLMCDYCDGSGREDCNACDGSGELECYECEGQGTIERPDENMCVVTIAVSFDRDLNRKLLNYVGKPLPSELLTKINKSFVVTNKVVSVNLNLQADKFVNLQADKFDVDDDVLLAVLDDPFDVWETALLIPTQRYPDEEIKATAETLIKKL